MLTAVLLSAVLSAVVAIAVTLVIERWGGRIGGVLGTIPTTIVPAGIGLALASDEAALAASLAVVPYGMLINGCFLLVYVLVPPRLSSDGGGARAQNRRFTKLFDVPQCPRNRGGCRGDLRRHARERGVGASR